MRKIVLALAAIGALGLALPAASPAKAEEGKIVIRTGDRDHHHHWRHHERMRHWEHRRVRHMERRMHMRHRDHDRTVVIRHHND